MSEKNNNTDSLKKYKELTKLEKTDYFLIILSTVILILLYCALGFQSDILCGYILPGGYLLTAFIFLFYFIKDMVKMNKEKDK